MDLTLRQLIAKMDAIESGNISEDNSIETLPAVAIEENPKDKVTVDIPLLIRLLEYAREDAKTDMDLHNVAEKMISISKEGQTLTMDDYDSICDGPETEVTENQSDDATQMEMMRKLINLITESRREVRKHVLRVVNMTGDQEVKDKMKSNAQLIDNMMAKVASQKERRYVELRRK